MGEAGWSGERWAVLGEAIARARRAKGWDQQDLANRSGNSATTISNYERGRAPKSRRVPAGVSRAGQALGWPLNAATRILAGANPERVLSEPDLVTVNQDRHEQAAHAKLGETPSEASTAFPWASARDIELVHSGHLAQDIFMRQAKRYRKLQGVSLEELARRVAQLGSDLPRNDLERLEAGTRLLRMAEAKFIASALETTVDWLLGSGFSGDAPEEMMWPPNAEEMEAEAKAVERRMGDVGAQVHSAHQQHVLALEREKQARQEADMAMAMLQSAISQQREIERHYQYLLGRIDSLRVAAGEPTIIETVPVYEGDETRAREDDLDDPPLTEV